MKRKTVTLCMIARNEEATVGRAIKSVLALVDEIIVVDTGSTDNTRLIAEGYGARIIDHAWQDDFSVARNAGLDAATSGWILVLDCDEHLQSVRPLVFQRLLGDVTAAGYRFRMAGHPIDERLAVDAGVRLFRSNPEVRFRYPVHEQIAPSLSSHAREAGLLVLDVPLVVIHDPGNPEQIARKRERNLRLLRQAVEREPGEPYFSMMLGSEMLSWLDEEVLPVAGLQTGLNHLEQAWRLICSRPPESQRQTNCGPALAVDLAGALLAAGRCQEAAAVVESARRRWSDGARLRLQGVRARIACLTGQDDPARRAAVAADVRRELQALDDLLSAEQPAGDSGRRWSGLARRYRGELALAAGDIAAAAEAFEQALAVHEDLSGAWVGLAECARLAGDRKRALRLYLRAVTASEWNYQAWERGVGLMEELGFHDNARSWQVKIQDRFVDRLNAAGGCDAHSCAPPPASDVVGIA